MIKGLEALEVIEEECSFAFGQTANGDRVRENLSIIKEEFKEYEELQKVLDDFRIYNTMNLISTLKTINYLETRHVLTAKKTKALEIIKEKDVSPIDIRCCETVEQYNVKENGFIRLTKEEFNLLKEVLL